MSRYPTHTLQYRTQEDAPRCWPHARGFVPVSRARHSAPIQRPPAFLRIASARRRARSRSADLLGSVVPRCDGLSESPAVAARPSRRAAALARAALLAFAAALMRVEPAAVLSRAGPADEGRDEGRDEISADRDEASPDLPLQPSSCASVEIPSRSRERLRAPEELSAARITLPRPARRDWGCQARPAGGPRHRH